MNPFENMKTTSLARACAIAVLLIAAPASLFGSEALEASEFASALQPYVDRHELAGAVILVASKDKTLSVEAVGYSDVAAKKHMQTNALFWIASMSKPITATALMLLVDAGKVHLDDPVEKYLPDFTPKIMAVTADGAHVKLEKPKHPITVRTLLSHTSGIPFRSSLEAPTRDRFPLSVHVQSYALEPLQFEPTSDFAYSNAGINTAARIIEVVSGQKVEDFLQQRLLGPLRMKDTTFWPTQAQVQRLAKPYKPNATGTELEETTIDQLRYPLTDRAHRYSMPAGGLFSTAADLGNFCQMILNDGRFDGQKLLSTAAIREMTRNQLLGPATQEMAQYQHTPSRPTDPDGYGLGWFTNDSGVFGHPGAYSTDIRIDPPHGIATVWLVQHAGFPGKGEESENTFNQTVAKHFNRGLRPHELTHIGRPHRKAGAWLP